MGEWSEYFEDFPEENPSNYIDGKYDPEKAKADEEQRRLNKLARAKANPNAEINALILEARKKRAKKKL